MHAYNHGYVLPTPPTKLFGWGLQKAKINNTQMSI